MSYRGLGAGLASIGVALVLASVGADVAAQTSDGSLSAAERRAIAASGLPRAQIVSIKRDLVVAIRSRGTSKGGVLFEGVTLHGEAVSAEAARNLGYHSMRSTVNIDCARRRDMVVRMTIYPEPNGKGEPILRQVPGGWIQPSPSAYLADVIEAVCSEAPRIAVEAPEPVQKPAPQRPAPATRAEAPPAPVPVSAPRVEPDEPPPVQSADSETIVTAVGARRPRLLMPPEIASSPPVPAVRTAAPTPVPPLAPKPSPKPAPVVAPAPKAAPLRPGDVKVQIVAVGSERQARDALAKLGQLPAPLSTTIQTATVDGRVYHRGLVTGFSTRAEAKAFCDRVVSRGGGCFLR